jgi:hypothetical protein
LATLGVRPITVDNLPPAVALRPADEEECRAGGLSPLEALTTSIQLSHQAYEVVADDGWIIGWWGHAPVAVLGNIGVAWALTGPGADHHPFLLGRMSYNMSAHLMLRYAEVFCQVDLHHRVARNWLSRLGFDEINRSGRFATMRKVR